LQVLIFNRFTINLLPVINFPSSARVFPYSPACVLRVSGADAAAFLQGQFSNDLAGIGPGRASYGLWLDRKGHVVADSHVVGSEAAGEFWVASVSSDAAIVARRLGDFIIADDVAVEDVTCAWRGLALVGEGTGAWLAGEGRAGIRFPGRRSSAESWEWIWPAGSADPRPAGARTASAEEMERMRIESAIASVPRDIGPGELPNEGGLEGAAISYSKGCYLGQEVMARLKSRGSVRRALVRVRGAGAAPAVPAGLWAGEARAGELRSAVSDPGGGAFWGLALVSRSAAPAGASLSLAPGAPAALEVAHAR
jgi:folate-binding protein YgfZ